MTGPSSSRATSREQADLLLDPKHYRLLGALMGREKSAGDLAKELGEDLRRVHYLLGRLVKAGLAEVAGEDKRAGRPIKRYAMPPSWFVPFELTSAATVDALLSDQLRPRMDRFVGLLSRDLLETAGVGVRIDRGADEVLNVRLYDGGAPARPDVPLVANWTLLRLSNVRAGALLRELQSVLERYEALGDATGEEVRPYTIGVFLAEGDIT